MTNKKTPGWFSSGKLTLLTTAVRPSARSELIARGEALFAIEGQTVELDGLGGHAAHPAAVLVLIENQQRSAGAPGYQPAVAVPADADDIALEAEDFFLGKFVVFEHAQLQQHRLGILLVIA